MRKTTRTFILNDGRSVQRLSKNVGGEENSARSYFWFLHELLPCEKADCQGLPVRRSPGS
jgi:hypothetical protein